MTHPFPIGRLMPPRLRRRIGRAAAWAVFTLAAYATPMSAQTPLPTPAPAPQSPAASAAIAGARAAPMAPEAHVRSTILAGQAPPPLAPVVRPAPGSVRSGDVTLNYPGVDVRDAARAILGDLLGLGYAIDPGVNGTVSVVTAQPISRSEVLLVFEDSLRAANLALVRRAGSYAITPLAAAKGQSAPGPDEVGYADETVPLKFISAPELKKLLDPVVPGAISVADPVRNVIMVSGTSTQRRSIRELVAQFDVDWLRGMSFALFVPQHTDGRLIAPELDKVINGQGAPTQGLVRLITLDRLNGIVAIATQPQYLDDVRRWIEVLDREGESSEPRLFVYRVQNSRASDLAKTLLAAFGGGQAGGRQGQAQGPGNAFGASPDGITPGVAPVGGGDTSLLGGAGAAGAAGTGSNLAAQSGAAGVPLPTAAGAPPVGGGSGRSGLGPNVTITSDETNNALVVYCTPREYALIEDALRKLDIVPLQVLIEAAITEVALTHNLRYGVQFQFQAGNNNYALSQGTSGLPVQAFPGFSYLYGAAGSNITATLNALSKLTKVNVLSAPKLMVLNNHTASLQVGDQVPVATASSVGTISANSPIVNSIEYRDTGVILKITPRVNASGLVLLDVAQEVSDVSSTSSSAIDSPTISQRRVSSSVAVQDGETIALGGLIRDNRSKGRSGLPILGAIPGLGALFSDHTDADLRTELLVLLTPRVVRSPVEAETVTQELRRKIQNIEPLPTFHAFKP